MSPPFGTGSCSSLDLTLLSAEDPHLDLVSCVVGILQSDVRLRGSNPRPLGSQASAVPNVLKFYSASSLLGFRSAIHRKLVELKRLMNVHSDPAFKDANIALKAFLLKPKKAGRSQSGGAQTPHQRRRHEQAVPLLP